MFSKGSSSSISLAIVTPSLVIVGAPYFLSRTTLRPFGPERDADGVGQTVDAVLEAPARRLIEEELLGHGVCCPSRSVRWARRRRPGSAGVEALT